MATTTAPETRGPWIVDHPRPAEWTILGREDDDRLVLVATVEDEADARAIAGAINLLNGWEA